MSEKDQTHAEYSGGSVASVIASNVAAAAVPDKKMACGVCTGVCRCGYTHKTNEPISDAVKGISISCNGTCTGSCHCEEDAHKAHKTLSDVAKGSSTSLDRAFDLAKANGSCGRCLKELEDLQNQIYNGSTLMQKYG